MAEGKEQFPELPDLHLGNVAQAICHKLRVPGAVVLVLNDDGTIGMSAQGVNHFKANELLSVGIHFNLMQHDQQVLAGAAGEHAREVAQHLADGGDEQ